MQCNIMQSCFYIRIKEYPIDFIKIISGGKF